MHVQTIDSIPIIPKNEHKARIKPENHGYSPKIWGLGKTNKKYIQILVIATKQIWYINNKGIKGFLKLYFNITMLTEIHSYWLIECNFKFNLS